MTAVAVIAPTLGVWLLVAPFLLGTPGARRRRLGWRADCRRPVIRHVMVDARQFTCAHPALVADCLCAVARGGAVALGYRHLTSAAANDVIIGALVASAGVIRQWSDLTQGLKDHENG